MANPIDELTKDGYDVQFGTVRRLGHTHVRTLPHGILAERTRPLPSHEASTPHPYTHYRLEVTIRQVPHYHPQQRYVQLVPVGQLRHPARRPGPAQAQSDYSVRSIQVREHPSVKRARSAVRGQNRRNIFAPGRVLYRAAAARVNPYVGSD